MEKPPQSFDVCIVCALPEEARAFLEVLQQQCEGVPEEHISPRYQYSYRFAAIKNNKDEPLNLHISWLPRYGPQEMTLHLSRVLEECQPRIAIMTGICAGDAQQAQLGDLAVAERTFTYDNGKFAFDEQGRSVHLHDTLTYQLDSNVLQFLGLFDDWKPLVAGLERPPSSHKQYETACHIKAMASGSAVRADHPFEDVRAPVRGTIAIDMEGAAFGLVMSRHPLIRWLIVKGICDYADQRKNDVYHNYAARASALYALSFIRAFVTGERLPRRDTPPASDRAGPSGVWNVPYLRNPHFTGRDELLDQLHQQLSSEEPGASTITRRAALTQPQAIKGLGGIGKTQIAVEYAYRSREQGRYIHTLWVDAASEEAITASFVTLAELLPAFPAKDEADHRKLVAAIKHWLEQCNQRWLLIFDNADDISLVHEYLPQWGNGSILLTTRANAVGSLAASLEVEKMGLREGTQLLLHRAQRHGDLSEEGKEATNVVMALDGLPLALDQAGAYIEETGCDFSTYLQLYQDRRKVLLDRRGKQVIGYPDSVATTWSLSFQKVEQANIAAAELLRLCAFLSPDRIPDELVRDGVPHWTSPLQQAADLFSFNQMIEELLKFSLVKRLADDHMLSIHRLVQAVLLDAMTEQEREGWIQRVIKAIETIFPDSEYAAWKRCERLLLHALICMEQVSSTNENLELTWIAGKSANYLCDHARYVEAEPLYLRALRIREQILGTDHLLVTYPLMGLANLYVSQGKYIKAEPLYLRVLRIREQYLGMDHPDVADPFYGLARLYREQGKYVEAEALYQRALSMWEQALGSNHSRVAFALTGLADLYFQQGKYTEAEPLSRRALQIQEQILGPDHPQIADSLVGLANLSSAQEKYAEAESFYLRTLRIREAALGPDHPDVANSLVGLAIHYCEQGKPIEAESLYQRALRIQEQALEPDHPTMILTLTGLANLYRDQGKYGEAEPLYQRALHIQEQALEPDHPQVVSLLTNLANLYREQKKYAEAEPLYQKAVLLWQQAMGPDHSQVAYALYNLAKLYYEQKKLAEAESLYRQALHLWEQAMGPDYPQLDLPLNDLATLYSMQGKYVEAEPLYQRSLHIREHNLGYKHPDVASQLNNLANLYSIQGKYVEAEPLYQRALHLWEQAMGPDHPQLALPLNNLASLYSVQGKYVEAESLYQRVLRICEQIWGPDHSEVSYPLNGLANLYREQKKDEQVVPLYQRALHIREQTLGEQHPDTARILHNFATFQESQGNYQEAVHLYQRALIIHEQAYGLAHSQTIETREHLRAVLQALGRMEEATQLDVVQPEPAVAEDEYQARQEK